MPCGDPLDYKNDRIDTLKGEVSKLTKLLCSICSICYEDVLPDDVAAWWNKHQEIDRKRLNRELKEKSDAAYKKKLIAGMSKYERGLLGLD